MGDRGFLCKRQETELETAPTVTEAFAQWSTISPPTSAQLSFFHASTPNGLTSYQAHISREIPNFHAHYTLNGFPVTQLPSFSSLSPDYIPLSDIRSTSVSPTCDDDEAGLRFLSSSSTYVVSSPAKSKGESRSSTVSTPFEQHFGFASYCDWSSPDVRISPIHHASQSSPNPLFQFGQIKVTPQIEYGRHALHAKIRGNSESTTQNERATTMPFIQRLINALSPGSRAQHATPSSSLPSPSVSHAASLHSVSPFSLSPLSTCSSTRASAPPTSVKPRPPFVLDPADFSSDLPELEHRYSTRSQARSTLTKSACTSKKDSALFSPSNLSRKRRRLQSTATESSVLANQTYDSSGDRPSKSKRSRTALSDKPTPQQAAGSLSEDLLHLPLRTFPNDIPINTDFPLFYRQFPISSFLQDQHTSEWVFPSKKHSSPGGIYNPPRDAFDLYTPRFVKGSGRTKVGLCPVCFENEDRGGGGKKLWLAMKFSAYKWCTHSFYEQPYYHMQYSHGISASTGRPFSPPTAYRVATRSLSHKTEKSEMTEGKCHKCQKWVALEGVKNVEVKVKEIFWWKHAAACHQGSTIDGEDNLFVEDRIHALLTRS